MHTADGFPFFSFLNNNNVGLNNVQYRSLCQGELRRKSTVHFRARHICPAVEYGMVCPAPNGHLGTTKQRPIVRLIVIHHGRLPHTSIWGF
jgi:hypothetical protein